MFFRSFPLFTILGFRVRLDFGWLLLALLIVTTTAQDVTGPPLSLGPAGAVMLGLFFAFGLLMSIVLHELSHSLVARSHGIQIRGITLFLLGGVAEMEGEPERPGTEFLIAIVGPLSSLVIAGAFFAGAWGSDAAGAPPGAAALLGLLGWMNVRLAIFNMVPGFPLDGGRVLRAALWKLKGDVMWATKISARLGQGFGGLLIGLAILFLAWGNPGAILLGLIGWFLIKAAPMPYRDLLLRSRLATSTIARFVDARPVVVPHDLPVDELLRRTRSLSEDEVLPVVEEGRIVGLVPLAAARLLPEGERALRLAGDLAIRLAGDAVVTTSTTAAEAVSRMQRLRIPALLVVDAAQLIGIVRWNDLLRLANGAA